MTGKTKFWEVLNRVLHSERTHVRERIIPPAPPHELADSVKITGESPRPHIRGEGTLGEIRRQAEFENQTLEEVFGKNS